MFKRIAIAMVFVFGLVGYGLSECVVTAQASTNEEQTAQQMFDVSAFDAWCGDNYENGVIRMVGGWYYSQDMVEDETGNVWYVDVPVAEDDFLLLWIADNNTADVTDDIIIKVWAEVH